VLGFLTALLAAGGSTSSGSNAAGFLLPLLLMGFIFYFLLIRPQQRQRRAHRDLIQSVDVGDEVVTIGGLYGTVKAVDEESLTLEVAPGVDMRFARGAIARKLVLDDEYEDVADTEEDHPASDEEPDEAPPPKQDWRTGPWFGRGARRRGRGEEADEKS
jgi:preprotein translocase subunit YajC